MRRKQQLQMERRTIRDLLKVRRRITGKLVGQRRKMIRKQLVGTQRMTRKQLGKRRKMIKKLGRIRR